MCHALAIGRHERDYARTQMPGFDELARRLPGCASCQGPCMHLPRLSRDLALHDGKDLASPRVTFAWARDLLMMCADRESHSPATQPSAGMSPATNRVTWQRMTPAELLRSGNASADPSTEAALAQRDLSVTSHRMDASAARSTARISTSTRAPLVPVPHNTKVRTLTKLTRRVASVGF